MRKSSKIMFYELFENMGRIEEICISLSYYFSAIHNNEKKFGKRAKYATVSQQAIFLAIQRSKSLAKEIKRNIEIMKENEIIDENIGLENAISELIEMTLAIERDYANERFSGITKKLEKIGEKANEIKYAFKEILV